MTIEAINPIQMLETITSITGPAQSEKTSFAEWLSSEVQSTNTEIKEAEHAVQKLAVGEADNIHQVMISISKAKTSFEMTVQVRNRLLEGFQEIMRMSV